MWMVLGLVGAAVQSNSSVGWVIFMGGLVMLAGILYYFMKIEK